MSRNPWAAVWVTALCVCFMAVVVAPAALAYDSPAPQPNADPSHPVKLDPNKVYPDQPDVPSLGTTPPPGEMSALAGSRLYVNVTSSDGGNGYARVRIGPGDLVEGNAIKGTAFDHQYNDATGSWFAGYVYWELDGCGWILGTDLGSPSGTGGTACSTNAGRNGYEIGYSWNGHSNCTPDGQCDGSHAGVGCDPVPEYANVRPWSATPSPGTAIRYVANPGHVWEMYWRYITNDDQWVMARDPHINSPTDGNWVFVPKSCFDGFGFPDARPITDY